MGFVCTSEGRTTSFCEVLEVRWEVFGAGALDRDARLAIGGMVESFWEGILVGLRRRPGRAGAVERRVGLGRSDIGVEIK